MIREFLDSLKQSPRRKDVFNPWWEVDLDNDIDEQSPLVRREQLFHYLAERIGKASLLLVAEAIGYQGGHFTGIPMTSERILLGGNVKNGILPEHVFNGIKARRTSRPDLKPQGFSEPTATIVWGHLVGLGMNPKSFVLWNAYPWHPYRPDSGLLSNRTPDQKELKLGAEILNALIKIARIKNIVAIGQKAHEQLCLLGVEPTKVRHPANGGARKFREQFASYISPFELLA